MIERYCEDMKARLAALKNRRVLACVSGGVDSTVCAALLREAGLEFQSVLIDTGFLAQGEPESSIALLQQAGLRVEVIDARERFYSGVSASLSGVAKRDAFRTIYFAVLKDLLSQRRIEFLAQGTQFKTITTRAHTTLDTRAHNALPEWLVEKHALVEPVLGLPKQRVREIAAYLGLPAQIVSRRPFPGPGLLLRFGGRFSAEKLATVRTATHVVDAFLDEHAAAFRDCFQLFPYLADGQPAFYIDRADRCSSGQILLLRSIRSSDRGAQINYLPHAIPGHLQAELVDRLMGIEGIARVCLDLTPKAAMHSATQTPIVTYLAGGTVEYS